MQCLKIGKKPCIIKQKGRKDINVVLDNVMYVPELWVNLISMSKLLENKWSIGNEGLKIYVHKNNAKIFFDQTYKTPNGKLIGVEVENLKRTTREGRVAIQEDGRDKEPPRMTMEEAH